MRNIRDRWTLAISGFLMIAALVGGAIYLVSSLQVTPQEIEAALDRGAPIYLIGAGIALLLILSGFTIVQPNQALVLTFFGRYFGTVRHSGFHWVMPLTGRDRVSLKVVSLNTKTLKVNDAKGNPIEIGAVIVWHVADAARASLNVDSYHEFVMVQSETAVRALASRFPYDSDDGDESLRGSPEKISEDLLEELQQRVEVAGIMVTEARLSHLAYAPEIASAMLRRQQAQAVVSARRIITENAVAIVDDALHNLEASGVVSLGDDAKARLVSNLLVALVSERDAQPVLDLSP